MITIKDIAKSANVSIATVSRVLNAPETVSNKRRQRVLEAMEELHYTPNLIARELKTNSTRLIGLLLPEITNSFSPTVVDSFLSAMDLHGYNTLICITNSNPQKEYEYIEMMHKKRVEGLVFLGSRFMSSKNDDYIERIAKKVPVVVLDYLDRPSVSHVITDEEEGAYLATRYLLELGHRNIAFLNGDYSKYATFHYKRQGFLRAIREASLTIRERYQLIVPPTDLGGYQGSLALFQYSEPPTAILTAGDQIAGGVYRAAQENGISIPDDLSVIGYSGSPLSLWVYPPMCTVAQYAQEAGEQAAHTMLSLLDGEQTAPVDTIFKPKILQRRSCAAPASR